MKNIIIGLFIVLNLHAQTYEELLEQAIQNNGQLKIVQSQQEELSLQGQIDIRLKNPNLELEVVDFSSHFLTESNNFGARVGLSQSILLPHIKEDKQSITAKKIAVEQERYTLKKSDFIYKFNLKYLAHTRAIAEVQLHKKVLNISSNLLETVRQRYEHGAIAKSEFLEAKLAHQVILNRLNLLEFEMTTSKNSLLTFSSLPMQTNIEGEHFFQSFTTQNTHPLIKLNRAEKKVSQAKLELLKHSVERVEVFSELEREPDQDVFRVGFSIDLPTFNLHNEEKQLEKIKISNQQLLIATQERNVNLKINQIQAEQRNLEQINQGYAQFILEQKELFDMYQQSYKVAQVNFVKLQKVLERIVKTEKKLLSNKFSIKENIIKINYLQGAYSE